MKSPHVSVTVCGDYALFSRPEFKVERVSYPVITPSAARGLLESIYWKPEFRYRIRRIDVVKQGTQVGVLRNEITDRQGATPIVIEQKRTQRTALMLREVKYVIHADIVLRPHATESFEAYVCQTHRHVKRGSCFQQPYLGTRECVADFRLFDSEQDRPDASVNLDIGTMLFDVAFVPDEAKADFQFRRQNGNGKRWVKGYAHPLFFPAEIKAGVLTIPQGLYDELQALERHAA